MDLPSDVINDRITREDRKGNYAANGLAKRGVALHPPNARQLAFCQAVSWMQGDLAFTQEEETKDAQEHLYPWLQEFRLRIGPSFLLIPGSKMLILENR